MQLNLGNLTAGRNVVLSGNHVYGNNYALGSFNSTQIVAGGMVTGGQIWAF